jgi:hypothetical protein
MPDGDLSAVDALSFDASSISLLASPGGGLIRDRPNRRPWHLHVIAPEAA